MKYIDSLIENCKKAKNANPKRTFVCHDLKDLDGVKNAVYTIKDLSGDINKTHDDFAAYKAKKERKCPKVNSPSETMYVGSSTTSIRKRIDQHQGNGHQATYALHLKYWFEGEYEITVMEYCESREVVQIIEDALSEELSPAFGKRGGNGR